MLKMDGYEASRQIRTWERIWLRETAKRLPPVAIIDFSASVPRRGGGTVPTGGHRGLCQQILRWSHLLIAIQQWVGSRTRPVQVEAEAKQSIGALAFSS